MVSFRGFLLLLMIIAVCRAEIIFKSPSMAEVVDPGPYKIRASDSGIVPTLEQFDDSSWEVVLFTGNDTAPFELYIFKLSGYQMNDPTTQSPPVNIRNSSGPNLEDKYFFGYRSYLTSNESIWITAYSDRFTLTNMTGSLPDDVIAANDNVNSTTAPKRTISCGAKSGGECDEKVLENLGLGSLTTDTPSDSTTATATTTGSAPENTTSIASQADSNTDSGKRLSRGAFAGIVVGVAVAISIVIAAGVFYIMKAKKKKDILKREMIRSNEGLTYQESNAFHEGDTYGGVMKKNGIGGVGRREELEDRRTYEMSAGHHGVAEMPQN
ncbi:uncharacterized protein EAF01_000223 [Botrytis porri]|uniref:Mid2 domain-containing protein n=1 Tax=Botrytis porri TaxID=87229 RepID=A0A4Z1KT49_9HELO|nr:uncharacterized protein EAF01_000223 [Botrytis porri]KAF7913817.1 hypothetical protein EAF01_000223 [Botrytis porri]TGO86959.1 hypothetical protein BPOR_0263g00040 [Botrytis porri]